MYKHIIRKMTNATDTMVTMMSLTVIFFFNVLTGGGINFFFFLRCLDLMVYE